jgi:nitroimidazol reductase NimA-like FMN-containing flavoprotein (pyridoxamine 5'-phosphate oxidase superfamily)
MRRKDRERDAEFAKAVIDRCSHGIVAISTGTDTPYCLPLSLVRVDNRLYFHCAHEGRKVDLLRNNPRVCVSFVETDTPSFVPPAMFTTLFHSAIVTGTAHEVVEDAEKIEALRALCQRMTPEGMVGDAFDRAVNHSIAATAIWRIDMDEIIGKEKAM